MIFDLMRTKCRCGLPTLLILDSYGKSSDVANLFNLYYNCAKYDEGLCDFLRYKKRFPDAKIMIDNIQKDKSFTSTQSEDMTEYSKKLEESDVLCC